MFIKCLKCKAEFEARYTDRNVESCAYCTPQPKAHKPVAKHPSKDNQERNHAFRQNK